MAFTLIAAACGGGSSGSPSRTITIQPPAQRAAAPPAVVSTCAGASRGWRTLRVGSLQAASLGDGRNGVVFLNESGNDACPWVPLAQQLVAGGYRVALFEYRSVAAANEPRAVRDTRAVARALVQRRGRVALVGASLGGRIVFEVAASDAPMIAAIVSLSGERVVQDYADILPAARRVSVPLLYIGSRDDALTDGLRQPRQLLRAVRSNVRHSILVSGGQHGTDLLFGDQRRRLTDRIERFVQTMLR